MHIYLLEIDEKNPCVAFRCLFLSRKSPLHQWWGCFSNIKHHFQGRIIKTAPVRYAACLAVIFFGHRPAPKYVLKCSKNGSYIIGGKKCCINLMYWISFSTFPHQESPLFFFSSVPKIKGMKGSSHFPFQWPSESLIASIYVPWK